MDEYAKIHCRTKKCPYICPERALLHALFDHSALDSLQLKCIKRQISNFEGHVFIDQELPLFGCKALKINDSCDVYHKKGGSV